MTFGNIYWLYSFLPVLVILLIGFYYFQKNRQLLFKSFASVKLLENLICSYSPGRYYLKSILFLLAVFFLFLTLAQPRWGYKWEEQKSKGIDVLFALDVSKSMLAEDVKPNRLERAKYSILDLAKKLEGNRFGLIAFAGSAFLQCPLTLDYNAFTESLEQTDPSVMNHGGTDIAAAIRMAEPVFARENSFKILILISDGEELADSGIDQARIAAQNGITIYTVGVGTIQGELIPIKTKDSVDYLKDSEGKIVKTKLDETTLKKIAEATDGFYVPLGPKGEGLEQVYRLGLSGIPKQELSSSLRKVPLERFQWPLGICIFLLLIELLLSTRKSSRGEKKNGSKLTFSKTSCIISTILLLGLFSNDLDAGIISDAYQSYDRGEFNKASILYAKAKEKDPQNASLSYNLGTSLYQKGNYEASITALQEAVRPQNLDLQQKTFYNLGNATYRKGELASQTNRQQTIGLWEESLEHYQNAMELDPKDIQSRENFEFVKKKLEALKQQQQNQNNQDQAKEKNEDQDSQNNPEQSKNSQKEDSKNDSKENSGNNGNDNSQSKNSEENPETPPDEPNDSPKNDSTKSENTKSSDSEQTQSSKKTRRMNKEEATELLKTLKNAEQKMPTARAKADESGLHEDNFKDW